MRKTRALLNNEQGVAIVLAVMVLLVLTGILLAFLSVSALEPQISRNVADTARARYLAEAGVEIGFNLLVNTGDAAQSFTPALAGATGTNPWVTLVNNGTLSGVTTGGSGGRSRVCRQLQRGRPQRLSGRRLRAHRTVGRALGGPR